jgi:hypothetical protein
MDQIKELKNNIGKTISVVYCWDTTGSMRPALSAVRKTLRELVEQMSKDIPDLKIGLIAHGDYCDGENKIKVLDFTNDLEKIMDFISNTPHTSGGDAPECYELALSVASGMSWPVEGGSLVLIGDDQPHDPDYPMNSDHLDWRLELKALAEKNVKVFPMQCLYQQSRLAQNSFWEEVSGISETPLLILENFGDAAETLAAVAYASSSPAAYDSYMDRVADGCSTQNMTDIRSKLRSFVDNSTKGSDEKV